MTTDSDASIRARLLRVAHSNELLRADNAKLLEANQELLAEVKDMRERLKAVRRWLDEQEHGQASYDVALVSVGDVRGRLEA